MSWSNKGVARRTGESFHQQMRKVYLVVVLLCSFSFARAACCPSAIFFKVQHQSRQDLPTWFSLYQKKGKSSLQGQQSKQPYKPFITCFWHFDFVFWVVKKPSGKFGPDFLALNLLCSTRNHQQSHGRFKVAMPFSSRLILQLVATWIFMLGNPLFRRNSAELIECTAAVPSM